MSRPSAHYSYAHYADPEIARRFDERRFGGPIGELIAATQARVLVEALGTLGDLEAPGAGDALAGPGRLTGKTVLDVGAGTGRAAVLLAGQGARVTGIDASEEMLKVGRERAHAAGVDVSLQVGDAHALSFPDRSFDAVVCLRLLMHVPDWRTCLGELCRASRHVMILDYPSRRSMAAIEVLARRLGYALGLRTEPYRVLGHASIRRALASHGFQVRAVHRQFVLPIAFHKRIGSPGFTNAVEGVFERTGLLRVFGSPVTVVAERCASS